MTLDQLIAAALAAKADLGGEAPVLLADQELAGSFARASGAHGSLVHGVDYGNGIGGFEVEAQPGSRPLNAFVID